jgi:hypothetical protein
MRTDLSGPDASAAAQIFVTRELSPAPLMKRFFTR